MKRSAPVEAWVAKGLPRRSYFAHEAVWLAKQYPDTFLQLQRRGIGEDAAAKGTAYQLNLYARDVEDWPDELFSDPTVNWHRQQFGRKGLVAAAGLYEQDSRLFVILMQSDLCQQIFRHPALRQRCKTRLDNRFGDWPTSLLNAVLDFAMARGIDAVFVPTAAQILAGVERAVDPALFNRIYDEPPRRYSCHLTRVDGAEYWVVALANVADRVVPLQTIASADPTSPSGPTICLFHDTEGDVDTTVPTPQCRANLVRMLAIEAERGVRATYNILGTLFAETHVMVAARGHALGFHTYDHALDGVDQLRRVRRLDLQVRGYRPARSLLTPEVRDYRLSYFNFEWLLCSARTLGFDECRIESGIAKIPVHLDDYGLHTGEMTYAGWMERLRRLLATRRFVAIGLHDCYGHRWLDHFDELLVELGETGTLKTCDDIADELFLATDGCARGEVQSS
jgi:peptidoglycan/xylan/chitin deacetylase (PgdA/CDA1 family)